MNHQQHEVLLNNEFVAYNEAKLHVSDLAFQRGFGIFDFFKVMEGKPIFLKEHLARFAHSAKQMGLALPHTESVLIGRIETLLERNNLPFSGVKMTLTGGYSPDGFSLGEPNLLLVQQSFSVNKEAQERGIKLMTVNHQRQLPTIKTTDYLMAIKQLPLMRERGAQDVLYVNGGQVTECPRANFFLVSKQGEIWTPGRNILLGISRQKIMEFSEQGFNIKEGDIALGEVLEAKEAFISSTTKNILPVVAVDDHVFGDGLPGPITKDLMQRFAELLEKTIQNS